MEIFNFAKGNQNIFVTFLSLLKVKHTSSAIQKFNEHPNKYNLLGISQLLLDYGVKNAGIQIENKESDLFQLETPFIAHAGGSFVIVHMLTSERVHYIWNGKNIDTTFDEFIKAWSGIILIAEPNEHSIEPNYQENRQKEYFRQGQNYLLRFAICIAITLSCITNGIFYNVGLFLSSLVNLAGIYIGYQLILKQMHIQSSYADKICSLFKQSDCNDVLESKASRLMGVIGWSEVGLGYFSSNFLVILFLPHLLPYLAIINICSLPYTIWSVWYQKVKAKQWCPLCLIVQALLWSLFTINLIFGYIQLPEISIVDILSVGCIYSIPFLIINLYLPLLAKGNRMEQITQEINSLKMDDELFLVKLKKQPRYEVDKSTSRILFGNPDAKTLITILTNPHCDPCSRMHFRIESLLKNLKNKFCIQYIFSSFNEELESSSEFLIHSYLNNSYNKAIGIYHEWFEEGKYKKEEFFEKYKTNQSLKDIEYLKHKKWKKRSQLSATPTILINGYELPDNYKIEDLKFISEFDVNFK